MHLLLDGFSFKSSEITIVRITIRMGIEVILVGKKRAALLNCFRSFCLGRKAE